MGEAPRSLRGQNPDEKRRNHGDDHPGWGGEERTRHGTEHARFEDAGAVFSDPEPYPSGGENTVKRPVVPEHYLATDADDPHAEIVAVPESAADLGDLSLVVDGEGMTAPADAIGRAADDVDGALPDPADLDVPARAVDLLQLLREEIGAGGEVTKREAHDLAEAYDGDLDVDASRRTVSGWINVLEAEGVVQSAGTTSTGAALFEVP